MKARKIITTEKYGTKYEHIFKHYENAIKFRMRQRERNFKNKYNAMKISRIQQIEVRDYYYLVNHYSKEFINMTKQEMNKDLQNHYGDVVHPLPLLCRAETEEAGGGYHSDINREYIGKWCGDIISIYHVEDGVELEDKMLSKEYGFKDMTNVYFFKEEE